MWVLASVAFGFYVANFGKYQSTYGSLGGIIIFLLWLWLTNIALLLGAELDAELERVRELEAGIKAERHVQLPLRDTSGIGQGQARSTTSGCARAAAIRRARAALAARAARGRRSDAVLEPLPSEGARGSGRSS